MIITKYECDNCKKVQDTAEQMWNIGYVCDLVGSGYYYTAQGKDIKSKSMWCRACCDKYHIVTPPPKAKENEQPIQEATLGEKLQAIIGEIAAEAMQS